MRRVFAFVMMAFLAGLATGLFARNSVVAAPRQTDTHGADLAAIEKLHRADEAARLSQDPAALTNLWSADGVNFGFPTPAVGQTAIKEAYEKFRSERQDFQVSKYAPDYKDMQTAIVDEWAIEVGYTDATFKMSANAPSVSAPRTKGMCLLRRQTDGSWKFALVGMK